MVFAEKIINWFVPNIKKGILGLILFIYFFFRFRDPLGYEIPLLVLIIAAYVLSCVLVTFYTSIKRKVIAVSVIAVLIILLLGVDAMIINNTINKPSLECVVDTDCIAYIEGGDLCSASCAQKDWEAYSPLVRSVFAAEENCEPIVCACVNSVCVVNSSEK